MECTCDGYGGECLVHYDEGEHPSAIARLRARAEQAERELSEAKAIIATSAEGYMALKARILALAEEWEHSSDEWADQHTGPYMWESRVLGKCARAIRKAVEGK